MHPLIVEQLATAKIAEDRRRAAAHRRVTSATRRAPRVGVWQAALQVVAALASRSPDRPAQPRIARSGPAIHGRR
jgi:hypothetical protein